jgi:hypothetical protein
VTDPRLCAAPPWRRSWAAHVCGRPPLPPLRSGRSLCFCAAIRQAIAKSLVAFYQKYVDEATKKEIKDILLSYDRTLLVADPRRCEPKKFGGRAARAKYQKSCASWGPRLLPRCAVPLSDSPISSQTGEGAEERLLLRAGEGGAQHTQRDVVQPRCRVMSHRMCGWVTARESLKQGMRRNSSCQSHGRPLWAARSHSCAPC